MVEFWSGWTMDRGIVKRIEEGGLWVVPFSPFTEPEEVFVRNEHVVE
jgi:hypothetical protein